MQHSTFRSLAAIALAAILSACSTTSEDKTAAQSPNRIYAEAKEEVSSGNWERAIPLLEKLEGRAAGTPLAQQAQLEKAYAQYKSNDQASAIATLERFMKLHPVSPAYDYALYLKGLVNFNDNLGLLTIIAKQDLAERDQKAAKESFEAFKELVTRFPESKYTPDARLRLNFIVNSLAQYDVHVARYYFRRGAFVAAANRAQAALTDYKEVPANEEALFILARSYEALGMADLAADAQRVLDKNFPNSSFKSGSRPAEAKPWWRFF